MALIKCTECGKEFSDKAASCPNCGCPTEVIIEEIQKQEIQAKKEQRKANAQTHPFETHYKTYVEEEVPKEKKDYSFFIMIAVVVAIAIGGYLLTSSPNIEETSESTQTTTKPVVKVPEFNTEEYAKSLVEKEKLRAASEKQLKYEINELRKQLRSNVDTVENITWYHDKTTPQYISGNMIYCYMGESGLHRWLRVVYGFSRDEWIFMDSIVFNIDGKITRKVVRYDERHTDVNNGIYEWVDWQVLPVDEDFLLSIANSKSTQIKFSGDEGAKSFTVSKNQKKALKNIITYYRLREKLKEITMPNPHIS